MGWKRSRLRKLTIFVGLVASLALAMPAFASASRVLYASGHPIDTARLSKFGGHTLTATFDGCSDSEWASALSRTDFDVLIVGEDAPGCLASLSPDTLTAIRNFVSAGHPYIETGAHEDEAGFMNDVFGFSTTAEDSGSNETLTGTLQPSAAGTQFAGSPATLTDPSATVFLSGTPGTTIYSGPDGTWAFLASIGAGTVTYLGWDFCGEPDNCGNTPSVEDDWYRALDHAIVSNAFTIATIRRNKKKGNATITVNLPDAGQLVGSGKGVKAASAGGALTSKAVGAGQAKLVIKAKGKKKRKLSQKGKVKLNVAITFTPTGGKAKTVSLKVKLKKKIKK
jgi:hypothetical protein